ncbi:YoaK family protein [Alicyclobacillus herbarius]|uniref:YoaK family protein n=1 Tax=Alicyclobacillus herbarius TaxID=122960 RepID=UPI0023555CE4|nr:YoaK family protein [Alicyclobacillus herbarius]
MDSSHSFLHRLLMVLLTVTSGCVDAISFLALGQVFTAAMTGNTVLLGLAVAHAPGLVAVRYIAALGGFILGAALGAFILRKKPKTSRLDAAVTLVITIELFALVIFWILSTYGQGLAGGLDIDLVVVLAFAMGLQGTAARRVGISGVTTVVITSTLLGLMETVVWQWQHWIKRDLDKGQPSTSRASLLSALTWITVIVSYGVGAAVCSLLMRVFGLHAIWLPVCIVLVVVLTSLYTCLNMGTRENTHNVSA